MAQGTHSSTVSQLKDITVEYDCTLAAGKLTVFSDFDPAFSVQGTSSQQGGGLQGATAPTVVADLPVTVGRGSITIPLDNIGGGANYTEGTLFKFEVNPGATGVVRLFGAKVRHRKVGTYLQTNQSWRSTEMTLAG